RKHDPSRPPCLEDHFAGRVGRLGNLPEAREHNGGHLHSASQCLHQRARRQALLRRSSQAPLGGSAARLRVEPRELCGRRDLEGGAALASKASHLRRHESLPHQELVQRGRLRQRHGRHDRGVRPAEPLHGSHHPHRETSGRPFGDARAGRWPPGDLLPRPAWVCVHGAEGAGHDPGAYNPLAGRAWVQGRRLRGALAGAPRRGLLDCGRRRHWPLHP
ncbi:unnamed protein product, partial [Durusdinium trenchii]